MAAGVGCVHHWRFDEPEGPISRGVCKRCGAEQTASNVYGPDMTPKLWMRLWRSPVQKTNKGEMKHFPSTAMGRGHSDVVECPCGRVMGHAGQLRQHQRSCQVAKTASGTR